MQGRSPSLDLDSLYGHPDRRDEKLFDGPRFKIGRATGSKGGGKSSATTLDDLPRDPTERGKILFEDNFTDSGAHAIIPDQRNDENLAVGQIHLMWMLFHNRMVEAIESVNPDKDPEIVFREAREQVTLHYQYIVLHDYVRRIITEDVYLHVIDGQNRTLLQSCAAEVPFMPLEFSVAAYRMGHSMVRPTYEWNLNFSTGNKGPASLSQLFQFSGLSGTLAPAGKPAAHALPANWIVDYRRLFDLSGYNPTHLNGASKVASPNFAKKFDLCLALALSKLPTYMGQNLAFLNLRRGSMRGLPSGQDMATHIGINPLTIQQIKKISHPGSTFANVMDIYGLYNRTPLWLYILIEASEQQNGLRLGEMGSRILAETFLTLVICSRISFIGRGWKPSNSQNLTQAPLTTIADVLKWIDLDKPIVNPLEDTRV